jgi:hypothetical protein
MLDPADPLQIGEPGCGFTPRLGLVSVTAAGEQTGVVEEEQIPGVIDGTKDGVDAIAPTPQTINRFIQ